MSTGVDGRGRPGRVEARPPRPAGLSVAVAAVRSSVAASVLRCVLRFVTRTTADTVRICMRYRVTGLAAEAGFFALLSLPPLVLGLVGSVGYVGDRMGNDVVETLRARTSELAATFLTRDAVTSVILPTFDDVLATGRFEIVSIGFVLSLWSGSRALNVFIDTISIMYGLGGHRGIVRTRALSFSLYVASLLVGIVVIPLVLIGPGLVADLLTGWGVPLPAGLLTSLYWPLVTVTVVLLLATLYHLATPVRSPWLRDVPGALLALVIWVGSSFVLRRVIAASVGGTSIYGPLATPIVLLIWLYFIAIAVLIGAALNAAIDGMYPSPARVEARGVGGEFADELPVTPVRDLGEDDDLDRSLAHRPVA